MSSNQAGHDASRQSVGSLDASENAALGLAPGGEEESYDNAHDTFSPPAPSPRASESIPHRIRNDVEATLEKTEREGEVEPGYTQFCKKCNLHKAQLADIHKKAKMVDNRIDKLNDDVEKLRQQWSEVEREKAALLGSKERYQQKIAAQRKVVYRDDVTAKKYDNYLNLVAEVLVLDDSDDDEVEDSVMYDWGEQGQGGGGEEHEHEHEQ